MLVHSGSWCDSSRVENWCVSYSGGFDDDEASRLLLFGAVHFVAARAAIKNELSRHVHFSLYFDVGGIIYKAPRFELILLLQNGA